MWSISQMDSIFLQHLLHLMNLADFDRQLGKVREAMTKPGDKPAGGGAGGGGAHHATAILSTKDFS